MFDAVLLALLNDLRIRELSQHRPPVPPPSDDSGCPAESRPAVTKVGVVPRMLAETITLLLAVRIQIVIAR